MTQEADPPNDDPGSPKRKGLNLDLLFGPVASVATTVGTLHLYGLRSSDYGVLDGLAEKEPAARLRALLPSIASRVETKSFKEERQPLAPQEVGRLTDADLEGLAEAYAATLLRRVRADDDQERPQREENEAAAVFLDRLLKHEVRAQAEELRKMREKVLASTSSIFDQVRKSSSALGSTLSAFERLTRHAAPVEVSVPRMDHFNAINEHAARLARERADELEMVRLTGKMTAESAKTLKDLAEAATVLMERLDERDQKADKSTRTQITIAVWSVSVSAVLALFALIFSGLAFFQDKTNNDSGDKWQAELLAAIQEGNRQRSIAEQENQRLRTQVRELEAKMARRFAIQSTTPFEKSAASATLRTTKRSSTLLLP